MPSINEHSARQRDPDGYVKLRRERDAFAPGVHAVWGVTEDGAAELQSLRFSVSRWAAKDAREWLEEHGHSARWFEEAAKGSVGMCGTGLGFEATSDQQKHDGVPTRKFKKELARVGIYVHEGKKLELTHEAFDHWVLQFARMKEAGVKVPVAVGTHEEAIHPDDNRGWLIDVFREGDSLFMTCKIIGEDAIEAAPRSDVSVYAPGAWADGVGNQYVRPITHVLMVTDPVVPGLNDWIPLAASLSVITKEKNMDLKALGKALGLSLEKAEKPEDMVTEAFEKLRDAAKGEGEKLDARGKEVEALKLSLSEAGKQEPPEPDPQLVRLSIDNRKMKLDGLVAAGRLLPAIRDGMEKLFIGEAGAAIALSLKSRTDDRFDAIVELFAANDPIELGEKTGPQTLALQNKQADPKENKLVKDAKRRNEEHRKRYGLALVGAR